MLIYVKNIITFFIANVNSKKLNNSFYDLRRHTASFLDVVWRLLFFAIISVLCLVLAFFDAYHMRGKIFFKKLCIFSSVFDVM